jgi:hypothetical protein
MSMKFESATEGDCNKQVFPEDFKGRVLRQINLEGAKEIIHMNSLPSMRNG